MLWIIIGIILSYLLGSIPTAYFFGRMLKGIDIRKFGSGNIGATNALRVLGKGPGIAVLVLDMFKGLAAVVFLGDLLSLRIMEIPDATLRILLGISCICGHIWTVFLKFKGGKGVATTLGVLAALAFTIPGLNIILGLLLLTWLLVFLVFRIVSLASLLAFITLPIYAAIFKQSRFLITASIILALFAVIRHKTNIKRLLKRTEPRLNLKK
jgi:glycerol-3-phosphate acyltransferase PlsY